ncbi:murein hydrolase activator EnvC family protein [Algicola sagamiensis]|uniref:murein hydrolase activator EnvC family protein n=1 Tax=Algicola sagamiensis TaxID=163869 RepID=UPI0003709453|nr:peptidoglycan DD-metalloendopeptidase family protein [Algicola sagamiensis]
MPYRVSIFQSKPINSLTAICRVWLFSALVAFPAFAETVKEKEKTATQIDEITDEIKKKRLQIQHHQSKLDTIQQDLKQAESIISQVAKKLNDTEMDIQDLDKQLKQFQKEIRGLNREKRKHQQALKGLISSAYVNGDHDYTKLLLNQEEPGKFERVLVYYQYLNKARSRQLQQLSHVIDQISQTEEKTQVAKSDRMALKREQLAQQATLEQEQRKRHEVVRNLEQNLKNDKRSLSTLQVNREQLTATLQQLLQEQEAKEIQLNGLNGKRGKLLWPTKGKLRNAFGQPRLGRLRWKGVVINSRPGKTVKTIHQGVVLFADWMKGFGWVLIVDHGQGYMSLYGHNQTLLKKVGEKVEAGEPIALVGQSGGQLESGLYFEIRHKGQALDPVSWCNS